MRKFTARRGFTLIELLIVVIIIGIIAAIALPRFTDVKKKAYVSTLSSDLRTLATAQEVSLHNDVDSLATYVACDTISTGALCDNLSFTPSPEVRVETAVTTDLVSGWGANARHLKLKNTDNRCINVGDTTGVDFDGRDETVALGSQYTCTAAY